MLTSARFPNQFDMRLRSPVAMLVGECVLQAYAPPLTQINGAAYLRFDD
jgi:hypothetical protein